MRALTHLFPFFVAAAGAWKAHRKVRFREKLTNAAVMIQPTCPNRPKCREKLTVHREATARACGTRHRPNPNAGIHLKVFEDFLIKKLQQSNFTSEKS